MGGRYLFENNDEKFGWFCECEDSDVVFDLWKRRNFFASFNYNVFDENHICLQKEKD